MTVTRTHCASRSLRSALLSTVLGLASVPTLVLAQQSTTISGSVTEQASGQPLGDARIIVLGTSAVATTNIDGRYTIRNAPVGNVEVRVIRVGYQEQKSSGEDSTFSSSSGRTSHSSRPLCRRIDRRAVPDR